MQRSFFSIFESSDITKYCSHLLLHNYGYLDTNNVVCEVNLELCLIQLTGIISCQVDRNIFNAFTLLLDYSLSD
jgi:hypothetical protein